MILITFVNEKNRTIKRAFERTYEKEYSVVGYVGNCDCYKNTCDCVTVSEIKKDKIKKFEKIVVIEGEDD